MALKIILSSQVPAMAAFGRMGQFADYWPRHHSVTWLLPNFISYYATKFFSSVILNGLLLTPVPFSLLFPDLHLDFVKTTLLCSGYAWMLPLQKTFYTKYFWISNPLFLFSTVFIMKLYHLSIIYPVLAGVAQWIEYRPANQRVAGSIPSQGTCLGCRPGPQYGAHQRQPATTCRWFSPSFSLPSLKINK